MKDKKNLDKQSTNNNEEKLELEMDLHSLLLSNKTFVPQNVIMDFLVETKGNLNDIVNLIKPYTQKEEEIMTNTAATTKIMELLAEKINMPIKFSADKDIFILQALYVISSLLLFMQNNFELLLKEKE